MGLFSSKTIVTVATHVSRVIEDAAIPDSVKSGTIRSIFTEGQLVEHVLDDALSGIAQKAERMYQYGKRDYLYGLPTSAALNSRPSHVILQDIIQQFEGGPVSLVYSHYGVLNYLHYGWQLLVSMYQYNQQTNEIVGLSWEKGAPVYLQDMQVVLTKTTADSLKTDSLAQWGVAATAGYTPLRPAQNGNVFRSQTPFGVDTAAGNDYYLVTIAWADPRTRACHTEVVVMDLPLPSEEDYYQVKYIHGGIPKYFTYQDQTGTYPVLDNLYSPQYDDIGSFFPFGYFRYNKQSALDAPGSPEYVASKKLMKYLGMDYRQVASAIEENPDIEDVDSALLMMAVPAVSSNQMEQRYLFDFFKALHSQSGTVDAPMSVEHATISDVLNGNRPATAISMSVKDQRFTALLSMKGIYRKIKYGNLGKIGTYSSSSQSMSASILAKSLRAIPGVYIETGALYSILNGDDETTTFYYRKQVTETLYEEYMVDDLRMAYLVTGKVAEANILLVPLDRSLTTHYSALDREELYSRSMHYVINSRHEQKLKWYQQGWFQFVLIIVAIVLTVFTWGSDGGALAGALLAGTAVTLEYIIIYLIIVPYMVKQVMRLFVKMLGPEFAILASLVLAVWAGASAFNAGSIQGAPLAKDLLQLSTGLIKQVQDHYAAALQGISDESTEFGAFAQEKQNELETANKLLETDHTLSPFVLFGESPDDYFNRTVHSSNIGVAGIDAISNYVKLSLQLPKLQDTLSDDELAWG